jgi:hydrogenase maturation protein HypF
MTTARGRSPVEPTPAGDPSPQTAGAAARRWLLAGHVQGVGFRPFVHRLAARLGLTGWVRNLAGRVEIVAQGAADALARFERALIDEAPPLARPAFVESSAIAATPRDRFEIRASDVDAAPDIHVPPDYFACDDCLRELRDPADRRHRYPFINCTQCGPRYTLIARLPYDRPNTTLSGFALCPECRREYENPLDRRFHAEPIACPACGPQLQFHSPERGLIDDTAAALAACRAALRAGFVVAVKGVGGYHLMCDARNDTAVARLRAAKPRPHKPLAVMFPWSGAESANGPSLARGPRLDPIGESANGPHQVSGRTSGASRAPDSARGPRLDPIAETATAPSLARGPRLDPIADGLDYVREQAVLTPVHEALLRDPMRPIVLVTKRPDATLSEEIAPGLNELGAFLPYSPLHHLLLDDFGGPLVATSANVSGEPVLTDDAEVESRLAHVADAFLHHDRPIARPADDPVFRVIAGRARPLRLGRGVAPLEMELPCTLAEPVLAVGGHMKNAVALAWDNRVVVSPHIGDLGAPRSLAVFEQVIADLQTLYGVRATRIACDAHPGYASTRWARATGLPLTPVYHHHAHASALAGEYPRVTRWLVFAWDGVGYGEHGALWGGEALLGRPGAWKRVASFRPFRLPGGDKAGREPWRSALALCWEAGLEWPDCPADTNLLRQAWERRLNAPQTSAVGRLFDAAAAFTGRNCKSSFEGQGPMLLESAVNGDAQPVALPLAADENGVVRADWAPLLPTLMDTNRTPSERAAIFHASLAQTLVEQAKALREAHGDFTVGLTGGVFQNRVLVEAALARLAPAGLDARLAQRVPCNDAGIGYGQIIETVSSLRFQVDCTNLKHDT